MYGAFLNSNNYQSHHLYDLHLVLTVSGSTFPEVYIYIWVGFGIITSVSSQRDNVSVLVGGGGGGGDILELFMGKTVLATMLAICIP